MPKTPAQQSLDSLILAAVVPVLKRSGFRKDGRTFRLSQGRCVQVVNVQTSSWNSASELTFTLNLGVFYPEALELQRPVIRWKCAPSGPEEHECHARTRIGQLKPKNPYDTWWTVTDGQAWGAVGEEVGTLLRDQGMPWLETMSDLEKARDAAKFVQPFARMALALLSGDPTKAQKLVNQELRERVTEWPTGLAAWATLRGLSAGAR